MKRTNWMRSLWAVAAMLSFAAWPAVGSADDAPTQELKLVTYTKDVAPILNQNCVQCHRPGQIGPMSLMSYKETRPWAKGIRKAVEAKTMPPWFASPEDHGKFEEERGLTDQQIATLTRWVDEGAPMGDAADMPAPLVFKDDGWTIGKPDQVFKMEPYHVADDITDWYHHTMITANFDEDR